MRHRKQLLIFGALALLVSSIGLTGCEEESTGPKNAPPTITISASADSISQGNSVTLIAVTADDDGDAVGVEWDAPSGTFSSSEGDTVTWTAPETTGIVTITAEANDGTNVTQATRDIGVGVYVPSVQPYYMGAQACSGCHSTTYNAWAETNHADAFDRKIEDDPDHFTSYCYTCHTVGNDDTIDNGGYDENPIAALQNIQCENCHGPASAHIAGGGDPAQITVSVSEDVCAPCHMSSRNNNWSDWEASSHGGGSTMPPDGYPGASNGSCSRCHSGNGYIDHAAGSSAGTYDTDLISINCVACHDPHSDTNMHQIRKLDEVTMPGGEAVSEGGLGNLCLNCHNGRRSQADIEEQVADGDSHFGPHHGNQGAFLVPDVFYDVWDGAFTWSSSNHLLIEDACVTCHMVGHDGLNEYGYPNVSGHAWEASVEACEPCHGELTDYSDIMAKQDFDGNGVIEGVTVEVDSLMNILEAAIEATGLDSIDVLGLADSVGRDSTEAAASWAVVIGNGYTIPQVRGTAFNLLAVEYEHSHGVHNAAFTIQLLQQSYKFLTGNDITGAYMLASGEK